MKKLNKANYTSWESYYWDYQRHLAQDYYLPYLKKEGKVLSQSKENRSIIDIGCGNGGFISAFKEENSILGVDIKKFDNWKEQSETYKIHNILDDNNDSYYEKYDLVILRDVIEHIQQKDKFNFIKTASLFMKKEGEMLVTFPPYFSPFGLHQQALMQSFLRKTPYLSLLPEKILNLMVTKLENDDVWNKIDEIIQSGTTIYNFKRIVKKASLKIYKERYFSIRPSHEIRYGIRTLRSPFGKIPLIREISVLGTCYILKK